MRTRLVILMAAMAIIASGCFKVNFTIDVNEDGSGTVEGIVAFNPSALGELAEAFGEADQSADDLCAELDSQSGVDTQGFQEVRPYNEDGFCGTQFSGTFDSGEFSSATAGLDGSGEAILRQEPDGGWYFEAPFDAEDLGTGEVPPGFDDIFDGAEYVFRVRLPGQQVEHNGAIDPDGFVVWDVDITNPPDRLFLRTAPGQRLTGNASVGGDDGGSALTVILIVIAVLAALGLAAWFLMRNRSGDQDPPASGVAATIQGGSPAAPPVDPSMPAADVTGAGSTGWSPPTTADDGPPVDTTQTMPVAQPEPQPAAEPSPEVIASPTPEQATGSPVWDPVRRKYVQWDPNAGRWLVFDDATQTWGPEA